MGADSGLCSHDVPTLEDLEPGCATMVSLLAVAGQYDLSTAGTWTKTHKIFSLIWFSSANTRGSILSPFA